MMAREIEQAMRGDDEGFHIGFIAGRQSLRHDVIQALARYDTADELRDRVMRAMGNG